MKRLFEGTIGFLITGILGVVFIGILHFIGYLIVAPLIDYKIDPRIQQVISVLLFTLSFLGGYFIYRSIRSKVLKKGR